MYSFSTSSHFATFRLKSVKQQRHTECTQTNTVPTLLLLVYEVTSGEIILQMSNRSTSSESSVPTKDATLCTL